MNRLLILALVLAGLVFAGGRASAHPHVWVTMSSEVLYDSKGDVTGLRHAWTFDDMYSAFATQGLESKQKGVFTREELASLAEVNISSLKEYDFFSYAKVNGTRAEFSDPVDYWLEYKNETLTLHFTLPLKKPAKTQNFNFEVYDPTYFVDFALAEKDPVRLAGAPSGCKVAIAKPEDAATMAKPGESFFNQADSSSNWGAQFASHISVKCP